MTDNTQTGAGSTGNVIAAVCSALIPGLGHLVQGRIIASIFFAILFWPAAWFGFLLFPLIIAAPAWVWCVISTAVYSPDSN
ncbi:MAG: TM2 domain-containing membrane protein YozV [Planctomycetota bacterium]|jgi:TM2 domain-containing membrane protein YozV